MNLLRLSSSQAGFRVDARAQTAASTALRRMVPAIGILAVFLLLDSSRPGMAQTAQVTINQSHPSCCASETGSFRTSPEDVIKKRFQMYRDAGFDMLRVEGVGWGALEPAQGAKGDPKDLPYLLLARDSGFRIKMNIGVLGAPGWFYAAHPEAQLVNEDGAPGRGEVSFWYPGLKKIIAANTDLAFQYLADHQLFTNLDYIAPDFGPASEPIYPAAWTQSGKAKKSGEAFWCYDANAQADFARKMKDKYQSIDTANTQWKTSFKDWSEVKVPQPGTTPGAYWEDVLTWYRDAKRDFVVWQIENFKSHMARYPEARSVKLLLYVPGSHYTDEDWQNAVNSGNGGAKIRIMCDSRFLLDTAGKEGCVLQYTGCENEPEVQFLLGYLKDHGLGSIPMWGENAGHAAIEPEHLADVVINNRLCGLDYTHTSSAFGPDLITPNDIFPRLKQALARIKQAH